MGCKNDFPKPFFVVAENRYFFYQEEKHAEVYMCCLLFMVSMLVVHVYNVSVFMKTAIMQHLIAVYHQQIS